MKLLNVYADTSVFGGVFDEEFARPSRLFFDLVRSRRFALVISDLCRRELDAAPENVRRLLDDLIGFTSLAPVDERVLALRDAYISAGIVGPKWLDDAGHVAAATVAEADLIVSWNFKHIVHYDKIRLYNAVNALHGYRAIEIRSPLEVVDYEDEEEDQDV